MANKIDKNKEYVLNIDGMGYQGEGVGKIEGFTIFVPGAIQGEKVRVKAVKVNKNFAFAKLMEVIEASKYRITPTCSIYKRCGGCQLQHLSYDGQLSFKENRVKDCLERIGKLQVISGEQSIHQHGSVTKLYHTIGMENPYRYRNKVQLPVGSSKNGINIGFYAKKSHEIINMTSCFIQSETSDKIVKLIRQWIEKYNIEPYNEKNGKGIIRHIMIREAFTTAEIMVVIVTAVSHLPYKKEFIEIITRNVPVIKSIVQNINRDRTNVIMGKECIILWGRDTINDYIGKFKFSISPLSFFQVNPVQTEVLYNKVLEYAGLTGNEVIFDAYCGTGTISLFLSQKAKKVYGVEIIPQAIENANMNAAENGIDNVEFITGKSEKVIPELIKKGVRADVVVVDPPRKGCEEALLHSIADMRPRTIVYVSCDPATLARDLAILRDFGYRVEKVQPVDMFPQTSHVETIVSLQRENL
ncbi:23S rRNA (uracil(1939)-C(5))-methyltransferase RlmD [Clostridium kluyveri]|uniref:tRNA (Uracil-5-)-methyltransferase-related protein n=2 Tax=Clostridium kluyveri TaxID=1534 RepID=A5N352_CLOK5|nr:23S rRNA (uracil(1939)-C(5))-methyltransferase RlmD [Clostridium kluyveri]EDK35548.1 TRNA (uracil-5-)-methyltransferase-related protein [Clostridium kluyveri DSM 555]